MRYSMEPMIHYEQEMDFVTGAVLGSLADHALESSTLVFWLACAVLQPPPLLLRCGSK